MANSTYKIITEEDGDILEETKETVKTYDIQYLKNKIAEMQKLVDKYENLKEIPK